MHKKQKIVSILRELERNVDLKKEKTLGIRDMINLKDFKKTIIIMLNWIIVCITCFTLALNVTKLSGNVFLNQD